MTAPVVEPPRTVAPFQRAPPSEDELTEAYYRISNNPALRSLLNSLGDPSTMTPTRQVTAHDSMLCFYVQHKQKTQVEMDNLVQRRDRHLRYCPNDFAAQGFTTKLRNKHIDIVHLDKLIKDLSRNKSIILARHPNCQEPGSYWLSPPSCPESRLRPPTIPTKRVVLTPSPAGQRQGNGTPPPLPGKGGGKHSVLRSCSQQDGKANREPNIKGKGNRPSSRPTGKGAPRSKGKSSAKGAKGEKEATRPTPKKRPDNMPANTDPLEPTGHEQAGQHKRPLDTETTTSPNPKRQLPPHLIESDQGDLKAPRGPLRKYQEEESYYSYESSPSETPSDQAPDPENDILLAGARILQNITKPVRPEGPQVVPAVEAQQIPPTAQDLVTEEVDYDADEKVCPLDLETETNGDGEQVSCSPP